MNRAARDYGNAQRFRKPTANTFGVRSTRSTLPPPPQVKTQTEKPADPPSYAHADKQQGEVDVDAEGKGREDEKIRENQGKDKDSTEQAQVTFTKPTQTVKDNHPDVRGATETKVRAAEQFENYWALETSLDLEEVTHEKPNYWTPNALALFEALNASRRFTVNSNIINKHHPEYLEYGVATYYAVIFHLQILRAKEAANRLTGEESSFLRRFRRKFPEETLPIAGHLFPILSSIVSVLLPDPKYNWIVPQTAGDIFGSTTTVSSLISGHTGGPFLQPVIPMMVAILREAILNAKEGNLQDGTHYTEDEYYVTNTFNDATDVALFGHKYRLNQTTTQDKNGMFNFVGISHPFDADSDQLKTASKHWARSSFNDLTLRVTSTYGTIVAPATVAPLTNDISITDLESLFVMKKSGSMDWFSILINQATTHSRFFKNGRNVSELPVTGGNETLVNTILRKNDNANHRIHHDHRGLGMILEANTKPWYPRQLRGLIAGFTTSRSLVQRSQILQALSFGTNARIFITIDGHVAGDGTSHRSGEFWKENNWNLEKYGGETDDGSATERALGKEMFKGWETMIQEKFVNVKPEGY